MDNGEFAMKCLLLMCSCQPFICILQVFASGFEQHFLLDFSEAMFTMKQFERVGGSFCAFCLFLLPKGATVKSIVYFPAFCAEAFLCIDMMFISTYVMIW